jgi:hypothetical protein
MKIGQGKSPRVNSCSELNVSVSTTNTTQTRSLMALPGSSIGTPMRSMKVLKSTTMSDAASKGAINLLISRDELFRALENIRFNLSASWGPNCPTVSPLTHSVTGILYSMVPLSVVKDILTFKQGFAAATIVAHDAVTARMVEVEGI